MALGGGNFLVQNKKLNGTYINFFSKFRPTFNFSDRGVTAIGIELDFGETEKLFLMEAEDLQRESLKLLGYEYSHDKLLPFREIFSGAKKLYVYRLNTNGEKATATIGTLTATAKYKGIRGNDITVKIDNDAINNEAFVVTTYIDNIKRDEQRNIKNVSDLDNNDFVDFSGSGNVNKNAGVKLTGGTNGTVTTQNHSDFLEMVEQIKFDTVICNSDDEGIKKLYVSFIKTLREDTGAKGQVVLYNKEKVNYEGVINVSTSAEGKDEKAPIYWVGGQVAGCNVNAAIDNKLYDGELKLKVKRKQRELTNEIVNGNFAFYQDNDDFRVLSDINSFTEFNPKKNEDFSKNQVIRVLDQIAIDFAYVFNKFYVGKIQNNIDGRISLFGEFQNQLKTLSDIGAIESVPKEDLIVKKGNTKEAVVVDIEVMPIMAMGKLYMTVIVA